MKTKEVIFIISAFLVCCVVNAQSIDTASVWRVNSSIWEPGVEMRYSFYKDYIDGDTTVNGIEYLKIYLSGYDRIEWIPTPYNNYYNHVFHGFLREEDHKWYTLCGDQDKLLFDFTLEVNDTVYSAFTFTMNVPITIAAIDSVMVGPSYKKRFLLNNEYGAEYIIEDIGATSGLFENMVFFEWDSELICFATNGISLWGASTEACDLNVNIAENQNTDQVIRVFPNPAQTEARIFIPVFSSETNLQYALYNYSGRLVEAGIIASAPLIISRRGLASGFYILVIADRNRMILGKTKLGFN